MQDETGSRLLVAGRPCAVAAHFDSPAQHLGHDLVDDVQPQPGAADAPLSAVIKLAEALNSPLSGRVELELDADGRARYSAGICQYPDECIPQCE